MPSPHSAPRLADHVRACRVGDQMIFLDLARGKYIGVGGPRVAGLSDALLGPPAGDHAPQAGGGLAPDGDWLARLRDQHLLSDAPATAAACRAPGLPEAVATLDIDDDDRVTRADWRALARLWRATFVSAAWLRRRSLAHIAGRITALRLRDARQGAPAPETMHAAAARYMRLRPFALTSHDRCLDDSLALTLFLAGQGLFPRWVIGVKTHPFGAHSWVQSGGVVLNDLPERVRRYRPILVV